MSNRPGNSPYSSPYQQPQFQQRPPAPKSSAGKIVLIILAVIGGISLLGCCSCGGLLVYFINAESDAIAESIKDDPIIIREIGTIESLDYNYTESGEQTDWDLFVYDIKGDKGSGKLFVTQPDVIATDMELKTANGSWNITFDESVLEY